MKIAEVSTTLSRDGRNRRPHLRPWRDGWRHLRFMMLLSPRWLFIIPGLVIFLFSSIFYFSILSNPLRIGNLVFDINSLFFSQTGMILGFISMILGLVVRVFAARENILAKDRFYYWLLNTPVLEFGGVIGLVLIIAGVFISVDLLSIWGAKDFGELQRGAFLRVVSFSTLLITFGGFGLISSLIMGFLALPIRRALD